MKKFQNQFVPFKGRFQKNVLKEIKNQNAQMMCMC